MEVWKRWCAHPGSDYCLKKSNHTLEPSEVGRNPSKTPDPLSPAFISVKVFAERQPRVWPSLLPSHLPSSPCTHLGVYGESSPWAWKPKPFIRESPGFLFSGFLFFQQYPPPVSCTARPAQSLNAQNNYPAAFSFEMGSHYVAWLSRVERDPPSSSVSKGLGVRVGWCLFFRCYLSQTLHQRCASVWPGLCPPHLRLPAFLRWVLGFAFFQGPAERA